MLVKTDQLGPRQTISVEQAPGVPRILAGNEGNLAQNSNDPIGDIFQIPYGCRGDIQSSGHQPDSSAGGPLRIRPSPVALLDILVVS